MILDVTRVLMPVGSAILGWLNALELGENGFHRLADDIGQHVETATMRHANDALEGAVVDQSIEASLHSWNEGLAALETKTLHSVELIGKELCKFISPKQTIQELDFLSLGHGVILLQLESISNPIAMVSLWDMHELNSNFTAVCFAKSLIELSQGPILLLAQDTSQLWDINKELAVEVSLGEAVKLVLDESLKVFTGMAVLGTDIERGKGLIKLEWIKVSLKMSISHERTDERHNLKCITLCCLRVLGASNFSHGCATHNSAFLNGCNDIL